MSKSAIVGFVVGLAGCVAIAAAYFMASNFKEQQDAAITASKTRTIPAPATQPSPTSVKRPAPVDQKDVTATRLRMRRTVAKGGTYQAGGEVEITLALGQSGTDPVRALGIVENIPEGWTFLAVVDGEHPDIYPPAGQANKLEFVWFNIPEFPASFTYRIRASETGETAEKITGEAIYRTSGPELRSGMVSSPLTVGTAAPAPAAPAAPQAAAEAPEAPKAAADAPVPAAGLTMTRQAAGYTPGQPAALEVNLNYGGEEAVTALAVRETLPEGWTFGEITGGARPSLSPKAGDAGAIDFVWINVPSWPAAFTYTVNVPGGESEPREVKGMAIYRSTGGELHSEPVVTKLEKAAS